MDYNWQAPVPWEHDTFSTTLERVAEAPRGWRATEVRAVIGLSQGAVRPLRDA